MFLLVLRWSLFGVCGNVFNIFYYHRIKSKVPTPVPAGNDWFWQRNVIQDRKSFITQSKLTIF